MKTKKNGYFQDFLKDYTVFLNDSFHMYLLCTLLKDLRMFVIVKNICFMMSYISNNFTSLTFQINCSGMH